LIGGKGNHQVDVLPVGTNGYLLKADSTQTVGLAWVNPAGVDTGAIPKSLVDAKGDIITATADNTPAKLTVGTDGYALIARSGATPGIAWEQQLVVVPFIIDGGGQVITAGIKGDVEIPFACSLVAVRLFADVAGTIQIDLWKDSYGNFPPVVGDTMISGTKPNLSGTATYQTTSFGSWVNSTFAAGDILRVNVDSSPAPATVTRVTLSITVARS
jgi:hypothetical protein